MLYQPHLAPELPQSLPFSNEPSQPPRSSRREAAHHRLVLHTRHTLSHSTLPSFPCPFLLGLPKVLGHLPASQAHASLEPSSGILSLSQEDPYFFKHSDDCCVATLFLAFQGRKNAHEILLRLSEKTTFG